MCWCRGYDLLYLYSTFQSSYGYTATVIPLAPQHGYSEADALLARLNQLFNKRKRDGRLAGFEAYYRVLKRGHSLKCL